MAQAKIAEIQSNQRVDFAGKTGSGKTFLAQYLLRPMRRLVVIDPKRTLGTPKWRMELPTKDNLKKLRDGESARIRFFDPPTIDKDGYPNWDSVFELVWEVEDCVLYIDEMYSATKNGYMTWPLRRLYTQGRELGIGVWASTQRPSRVPLEMFTEAEWSFIFMLNMQEDRKRIAKATGAAEIENPIRDEHGFWVYNVLWSNAYYMRRLEPPGKTYRSDFDVQLEEIAQGEYAGSETFTRSG